MGSGKNKGNSSLSLSKGYNDEIKIMLLLLAILLLILIGCIYVSYLLMAAFSAAPYVASQKAACHTMLDLANIKPGMRVVELGSGNGEVSIEAAKRGAMVIGIELNPVLVWWARYRAWRAGLHSRVTFIQGDIWRIPPQPADVICFYLLPETLERLWIYLCDIFPSGTVVISNAFAIPRVDAEQTVAAVYKYRI
jgi:SAM-dependent methyltransferase